MTVQVPESAIEAAARAEFEQSQVPTDTERWDTITEDDRQSYRDSASAGLAAAVPYIERVIRDDERAKIAAEIDGFVASRRDVNSRDFTRRAAYREAALIVRGEDPFGRVARGGEATQ